MEQETSLLSIAIGFGILASVMVWGLAALGRSMG